MAHLHARGYGASDDAHLVALADTNLENARAFQAEHGGQHLYDDYRTMLAKERLDIVSVCTWPHLHAEMVIAAAEAGVKAVYCEKPMAPTWGECVRMLEACEEHAVQLGFNHQRRFGSPYRTARELARSGAIGELTRLEGTCGNLFDWGTHWFDMMLFYNDETPVEWVIGQIDPRGGPEFFGVTVEGQGISYFKFANGVFGLLLTGSEGDKGGRSMNRLIGTDGAIEVGTGRDVPLRMWGKGQSEWQEVEVGGSLHGAELLVLAMCDFIEALKDGREPELSGRRALRATELIFATYESSRRRERIDLPLDTEDSPLQWIQEHSSARGLGSV